MENPLYSQTKLKDLKYIVPGEESQQWRRQVIEDVLISALLPIGIIFGIIIVLHFCEWIDTSPVVPITITAITIAFVFYKLYHLKSNSHYSRLKSQIHFMKHIIRTKRAKADPYLSALLSKDFEPEIKKLLIKLPEANQLDFLNNGLRFKYKGCQAEIIFKVYEK